MRTGLVAARHDGVVAKWPDRLPGLFTVTAVTLWSGAVLARQAFIMPHPKGRPGVIHTGALSTALPAVSRILCQDFYRVVCPLVGRDSIRAK